MDSFENFDFESLFAEVHQKPFSITRPFNDREQLRLEDTFAVPVNNERDGAYNTNGGYCVIA